MSENVAPADATPMPPAQETQSGAKPAEEAVPQTTPVGPSSTPRPEMDHAIAEEYSYLQPKRGEIREGRVIANRDDGIVVDLGLKREGFIPQDDVRQVGSDVVSALHEGDVIPVYVLRPENDKEGNVLVSWHRARQEQDWIDAQRIHDANEIWEGKVKGYNRGGLIVPYGKIRGFVPASQITGISRRMDSASLQARLAEMVGQTMPLKIIEVDRQNHRLILSERTARREWRVKRRERLLNELHEGDRVRGVVSNICDFGVFVDLGGTDGLIHISELSWRRTKHPSEVVKVGQEVEAYVLRVDRENRRIGLSLRLIEPDPWASVMERYKVGQLVTGTITQLIAFGAFAVLDDGIEGLIHISELADIPPKHPSEVVRSDEKLPLRIVKIDPQRRRMGLSLKRVTEEEWAQWQEDNRPQAPPEEAEPTHEELASKEPVDEETNWSSEEELAGEEAPAEAQAGPTLTEPMTMPPLDQATTASAPSEEEQNP